MVYGAIETIAQETLVYKDVECITDCRPGLYI